MQPGISPASLRGASAIHEYFTCCRRWLRVAVVLGLPAAAARRAAVEDAQASGASFRPLSIRSRAQYHRRLPGITAGQREMDEDGH